jgi:ubiquinone/menaquinone biosynthesis C-methylase UbiE
LDADKERFQYKGEIEFKQGDLNQGLPFEDTSFDYVVMLEVIEHLQNPYFVLREISRVLKKEGILLLSTPNILNLKSRFRFFFEGTYDYFREPPLELFHSSTHGFFDIHLFAYKYPELEYILFDTGFNIVKVFSSIFELQARILSVFCLPVMKAQAYFKCRRAKKKDDMDYARIYKILHSPELLYSRHLIIEARRRD